MIWKQLSCQNYSKDSKETKNYIEVLRSRSNALHQRTGTSPLTTADEEVTAHHHEPEELHHPLALNGVEVDTHP
jgi:phage portal protein BeeE